MKTLKICVTVALCGLASISAAQDASRGAEIFAQYCATCHGVEGRGNGPTASVLTLQPTDLTTLASLNGGAFPRVWAIARIDGRDPLVAHGSPMPLFGEFFEGKGQTIRGEDGVLIMTSQPVIDLVSYLESIQN